MNSPMEDRLRDALTEAGATLDPSTLKPLRAPERRFRVDLRLLSVATVVVLAGATTTVVLGAGGGDAASASASAAAGSGVVVGAGAVVGVTAGGVMV